MVTPERELEVEELTESFLDFTDHLVADTHSIHIQPDWEKAWDRPNRPSEFSLTVKEMDSEFALHKTYSGFDRHEWEEMIHFFEKLVSHWDVVAASVLASVAKDIARDELKRAYGLVSSVTCPYSRGESDSGC